MTWYLELGDRVRVAQFSRYLGETSGAELKKVMPQLLRIRQIQLKNDAIPGTWQGKTPEARIAEILCSFGHDRMKTLPDGAAERAAISDFEQAIRTSLGRWHATVIARTVRETDSDPTAPGDPRDPQYFVLAATKLARNPNIAAKQGELTTNTSIAVIMSLMGAACDVYDDILDSLWVDCQKYASQLAAKAYGEKNAELDAARLNATVVKAIRKIREHQTMKLDGGGLFGLKGGHDAGKFWMLNRCCDGMPILLLSSDEETDVSDEFTGQALSMASASDSTFCTGLFAQDRKSSEIRFFIHRGQTQTPMFVSALKAMGVRRSTVMSAPAATAWATATRN